MTIAVNTEGVAEVQTGPNRDVIEKWATALESGEYSQTKGKLHRTLGQYDQTVGYCCLGVLCDLAVKEGVLSADSVRTSEYGGWVSYDGEDDDLPRVVQEWAGLPSYNPDVDFVLTNEDRDEFDLEDEDVISRTSLAEINDTYGRDFKDIAQIIRANFLS